MKKWHYTWQQLVTSGAPEGRRRVTSCCRRLSPEVPLRSFRTYLINTNIRGQIGLSKECQTQKSKKICHVKDEKRFLCLHTIAE